MTTTIPAPSYLAGSRWLCKAAQTASPTPDMIADTTQEVA